MYNKLCMLINEMWIQLQGAKLTKDEADDLIEKLEKYRENLIIASLDDRGRERRDKLKKQSA